MKRRIIIALVLVLVVAFPAMLVARGGASEEGKCMKGLELNDEQQAKMEKLHLEHRLENIDRAATLRKLRLQMRMEFMKDDPSRKEIDLILSKIASIREEMQRSRIDHLFAAKEILTPEQWKKFIRHHWNKGRHRLRGRDGKGIPNHGMRGCRGMYGGHVCMHGGGEDEDGGGCLDYGGRRHRKYGRK
ncbi:MAG: periplasmic heavy metal sensor [bacterium]|nr:MAG: periplasmic heavy metal sensor [bacterium]